MIAKLYAYFGLVGIASILAWAASLAVLAIGARSGRRQPLCLAALALAVAALVLAKINSAAVSQIEPDRSKYLAAIREQQEAERHKEWEALRTTGDDIAGADLHPEEETPAPAGDDAKDEEAEADEGAEPTSRYLYREKGKQKRAAGRKRAIEDFQEILETEKAERGAARVMSERDVVRANRLDRINLSISRLVPWLALALIALDLLVRFNTVAGRVASSLSRTRHSVYVQARDPNAIARRLEVAVRKGESFLYFVPRDPWKAADLPRLALPRRGLRPMPKITLDSRAALFDSEFVFDSVWFARYGFVVTDIEAARVLVADLLDYLRLRRVPRAAAWRTMNVVWSFEEPLSPETVEELSFLARETNFRLIVASGEPPPAEVAPLFERVQLERRAPAVQAGRPAEPTPERS